MDDGYLIHESKEYLHHCLDCIQKVCDRLGIVLNRKKTKIMRIDKGFTYLKRRFFVTESGKIVMKIPRRSVTKMRQKLKKLKKRLDCGEITLKDIYQSYQSWRSYAMQFNAYHTVMTMDALYNKLF